MNSKRRCIITDAQLSEVIGWLRALSGWEHFPPIVVTALTNALDALDELQFRRHADPTHILAEVQPHSQP